ncbi:unnamed protein product [Mytilus edulis]|uniref:Uncharacterized protein n=1 Tax=Mytilus edulis TaxID=6550 RepID=A0A8S3RA06_MYTED|nr:unnamed protein product [Mytilus edulis]
MPAVQCPIPGCDYVTDDLDAAIVAPLITVHSTTHAPGPVTAAKVEKVKRRLYQQLELSGTRRTEHNILGSTPSSALENRVASEKSRRVNAFSNPITATAQTYYWIKNVKKHIQLTQSKYSIARDRSSQRLLLLLLSGIETNPGPRRPRFPFTICQKACKLESIACDDCDKWTHRNCIGMSTTEFSNLGRGL